MSFTEMLQKCMVRRCARIFHCHFDAFGDKGVPSFLCSILRSIESIQHGNFITSPESLHLQISRLVLRSEPLQAQLEDMAPPPPHWQMASSYVRLDHGLTVFVPPLFY